MDVNLIKEVLAKNSPAILTGLGIAGFVGTAVAAFKMSPAMTEEHEALAKKRENASKEAKKNLWIHEAKVLGPRVGLLVISGGASAACIVCAHNVQAKRAATLAAAYSLAEGTLSTYKDKVIEKLGEDGHEAIMQAVSDKLAEDDAPFDGGYSYHPEEDGKCMCYDRVTGRYFRSTPDEIKAAESEVNKRLIDESVVRLGEFYYELGLDDDGFVCDGLGWDISKGHMDVYFTSMLDKDENPCLVVNYNVSVVDRRIFESRR